MNIDRLLVSAAHKSSGKTTITLGLCAALSAQGVRVQPFKKGPDYIDPMWLARAAGRDCYNLDAYLMDDAALEQCFRGALGDAQIAIVEGNKGLYDGLALDGSNSNAALAMRLALPVLLVLDARGMTRGIAPLILGYQAFEPGVRIGGVILNRLGGSRHEAKLRAVIEHYTDVPVLGAVADDERLGLTERHLGLMPCAEVDDVQARVAEIGRIVAAQVDLARIRVLAASADELPDAAAQAASHAAAGGAADRTAATAASDASDAASDAEAAPAGNAPGDARGNAHAPGDARGNAHAPSDAPGNAHVPGDAPGNALSHRRRDARRGAVVAPLRASVPGSTAARGAPVRIAVARDRAFGFYYPDDLAALEAAGAQLVAFDTLHDEALPPSIDGLVIGGGFPETCLDALEANRALRAAIRDALGAGLPGYAECGGLMYLARSIAWRGRTAQMVGAIAGDALMHERPQGRGYVHLRETPAMPWPDAGSGADGAVRRATLRGHEFHHSSLENLPADTRYAFRVERGHGIDGENDGIVCGNLLASYAHLRSVAGTDWARRFVGFVRARRELVATQSRTSARQAA